MKKWEAKRKLKLYAVTREYMDAHNLCNYQIVYSRDAF